jgi:hypothetical protein
MDDVNQEVKTNLIGVILSLIVTYLWTELIIAWGNFKLDAAIPFLSSCGQAQIRLESARHGKCISKNYD